MVYILGWCPLTVFLIYVGCVNKFVLNTADACSQQTLFTTVYRLFIVAGSRYLLTSGASVVCVNIFHRNRRKQQQQQRDLGIPRRTYNPLRNISTNYMYIVPFSCCVDFPRDSYYIISYIMQPNAVLYIPRFQEAQDQIVNVGGGTGYRKHLHLLHIRDILS